MADVVNTAGSGQEDDTTGSTPLSTSGGSQSTQQDSSAQFSSDSGQPLDSGASAVEAQQTQTTNKAAPKASSGMFTNIQKYVEKNRPQAQAMGKAVKEDVENKAGDIRSAVEGAQKRLGEDIQRAEQARTGAEQFAKEQIQSIIQPTQQAQAPTEENRAKYQELLGGEIGGYIAPQAQDLSQQILDAKQLAQQTQKASTEQGRQNLLKETFKKQGDYTRGMSGLDQLIMAGDPAAMQQIADVQGIGNQLMQGSGVDDPSTPYIDESLGIQQVGSNMAAKAASEQAQKQDVLNRIKEQYGTAVSDIEKGIDTRQAEAQRFKDMIASEFGAGSDLEISKQVADALGLKEGIIYDVDPTSYYQSIMTDPTAAGVMTQDELDKIVALQNLGGQDLKYGGFTDVGGYDQSKLFDVGAFQDAIKSAESKLKVPEWQAAQTAITNRDAAARTISDVEKMLGTKDPSKMSELELAKDIGWDKARAYTAAVGQVGQYEKQLDDLSRQIYGGYDDGVKGSFNKQLDSNIITQALQNIANLQKRKLTIGE